MKFFSSLVAILPLCAAHHIRDFAGKQATQLLSPEEYINLGQAQIQTHNEVLRKEVPAAYYNPYYNPYLHHYNPYLFEHPIVTHKHHRFGFDLPKRIAYLPSEAYATPFISGASRIASPERRIVVGSLVNNNQGAVHKE